VANSNDQDAAGPPDAVEIEWQFDALDLRPVERWLATLPTLGLADDEQRTITALAKTPRRLVDSYLDTSDWRLAAAGFVVRTRRRGRQDEVTLKDTKEAPGGASWPRCCRCAPGGGPSRSGWAASTRPKWRWTTP
jgi:hypothetical protein